MKIKILPSLLAADVGELRKGALKAQDEGADELHLDIMDAHFVPNLSMGPDVVKMASESLTIPLSVHLMMTNPDKYLERFVDAGADTLFIHIEADCNVLETLRSIRERGARPGITLNPETSADMIFPALNVASEVLCMSVHPGYGGQSFMPVVLDKIRRIRNKAKELDNDSLDIMVDGGINVENAGRCAAMGANSFVAGTTLYGADNMQKEIEMMRLSAEENFSF